jgi:hypothetical protein
MRRAAILACLAGALLLASAPAAFAAGRPSSEATIGNIPGIELPPSGDVSGTVDASATADNVYWLYLERGSQPTFHLSAPFGDQTDLLLFGPGAADVSSPIYLFQDMTHSFPTTDTYPIDTSGYYFIDVFAKHGLSPYTMPYAVAGAPNDRLPGVRAASRPVVDYLEGRWDRDDVSSVALRAGDRLSLRLAVDPGQGHSDEFAPALLLFKPGTPSLEPTTLAGNPSLAARTADGEEGGELTYTAPAAGTYSVDAHAETGFGGTQLSWSVTPVRPAIARSPSSSRLTYKRKKKFTLGARFADQYGYPLSGRYVYLQRSTNGGKSWRTRVTARTDSAGLAAVKFTASKKSTVYYRWFSPGSPTSKSVYSSGQRVVIK